MFFVSNYINLISFIFLKEDNKGNMSKNTNQVIIAMLLGAMQVAQAAKGGGGGGSGGGGSGGTGGAGTGSPGSGDGEAQPEADIPGSEILKDFVLSLVIFCIVVCLFMFALNHYKREYRIKMDIGSALGLALAQISNEEDQNPNNIIKHGVGTDEANIKQWVDDIWETYDFNDDGNIDKREIKKFIN